MPEKDNIHKGHRQRMMKKFMEHGIECFEEHEVLEILLYSAYTRRNTNDIAHELIRRFGSLEGVLNASCDELCEVENVGQNAAAMLSFFKQFALNYSRQDSSGVSLLNSEDVRRFCFELMGGCTVEVVHALFLDDAYVLISQTQLSRGNTGKVYFDLKKIVKKALEHQCTKVVVAHNHPKGVAMPSQMDVATTRRIANALSNLGIELLDHIIVNEDDSYSMRTAGLLSDLWI
ncbi:MAG: DNA repair protein RadC [Ruminococcaceae bacterium]|nr:DNA repair protein RadC [Oscillospiraceae bacterium]